MAHGLAVLQVLRSSVVQAQGAVGTTAHDMAVVIGLAVVFPTATEHIS